MFLENTYREIAQDAIFKDDIEKLPRMIYLISHRYTITNDNDCKHGDEDEEEGFKYERSTASISR